MAEAELRLMAVHAHCDDETITMGGTLATYADRGVKTCVVCCTDGKLATIVDPDMPEETTRPRLAEIREAELREACSILKVDEVEFLRYGDFGHGRHADQLPPRRVLDGAARRGDRASSSLRSAASVRTL